MKKLTLLCFFVHFLCVNTSHGLTARTFQYDISGKLIELNNADCSRIQYEYDLSNRLVKVVDSDANIFHYHYDSNNNCIAADDRSGSTEYKYDLLNRLTAVTYPGIVPIRYSYDLRGCLEHIVYPGTLLKTVDFTDSLAYEMGSLLARIHMNRVAGYGDLIQPHGLNPDPRIHFTLKFEEGLEECSNHLPRTMPSLL